MNPLIGQTLILSKLVVKNDIYLIESVLIEQMKLKLKEISISQVDCGVFTLLIAS